MAALTPAVDETIAAVRPGDADVARQARERQDRLTKPRGALGVLEDVSVRLAALTGACPPPVPSAAAVAVFAADHGVHAQGVTPWPQEVTAQMVANFVAGGAAVNALAAQAGARVLVVDVGVAGPPHGAAAGHLDGLPDGPPDGRPDGRPDGPPDGLPDGVPMLLNRRVRAGTRDLTAGAALTRGEALRAVEVGIEVAALLVADGHDCLLTGDMGIANTTASAALVAAFTGAPAAEVTGRGTGIDDATWRRKVDVVDRGLARHAAVVAGAADDPVGVLAAFGGLEHAAIAGFVLGAAAHRVPVVLDGVIAGAAALVARALAPAALDACFAGHRSAEPGHAVALAALGLRPLVDLDLRLGEGTGAVLALPLVQAAARALRDMATFDAAGVVDKGAEPGPAAP